MTPHRGKRSLSEFIRLRHAAARRRLGVPQTQLQPTRNQPATAKETAPMPNLNEMYPSKWLKAADCDDGDLIVTIRDVGQEYVGQEGEADQKWVIYFHEVEKGLILNKTNSRAIAKLHGESTDDWIGKRIALFSMEVQFKQDVVPAIRVRSKAPRAAAKTIPVAPARATTPDPGAEMADDDKEDIPF